MGCYQFSLNSFVRWFAVVLLLNNAGQSSGKVANKLLLVSMDGFRWDYLKKVDTPNFDAMAQGGVKVDFVNNTFVTKTFPCHYTIVTGLYEESHGIIGNRMYDPTIPSNPYFGFRSTDPAWWNGGEPIWVTAVKAGKKAATFFWPGSEAKIRGYRPDIWLPYNESIDFRTRVDQVVDWFQNQNVSFATLYFNEPDTTGHKYGPDSPEIRAKVKEMDDLLGYLWQKVKDAGLSGSLNLIVTSDHGMASVDAFNKSINIWDYVNRSMIADVPEDGCVANIRPQDDQIEAVYAALSKANNAAVYLKENIPDHFHYKDNRRIMPIVMMADEGWQITKDISSLRRSNRLGNHGYDNRLMSMKPILLASGPDFRVGVEVPPIHSVDIYPLMCELLQIPPAPNNGSLALVKNLLLGNGSPVARQSWTCMISVFVLTVALGSFI